MKLHAVLFLKSISVPLVFLISTCILLGEIMSNPWVYLGNVCYCLRSGMVVDSWLPCLTGVADWMNLLFLQLNTK